MTPPKTARLMRVLLLDEHGSLLHEKRIDYSTSSYTLSSLHVRVYGRRAHVILHLVAEVLVAGALVVEAMVAGALAVRALVDEALAVRALVAGDTDNPC